jgi:hypothetical protein
MVTDKVDAASGAGLPSFVIVTGPLSWNPPEEVCVTVPPWIAMWWVCCMREVVPDVVSIFEEFRV